MLWQPGRGGLRFGGLTGLFYGVQMASSIARNRRDMQDTIFAALVSGAVMGTSGAPPCPALSGCSAAAYLAHRPSGHIMQEHFDTGYGPHMFYHVLAALQPREHASCMLSAFACYNSSARNSVSCRFALKTRCLLLQCLGM